MYRLLFVAGALAVATPALAQISDSPNHPNEDAAYYYFVAADGTITESFVMPCHNPNGDPEAPHIAEYWYNKNTGWKGTLLWEWFQHPTVPQYSHWLQWGGSSQYSEDEFIGWCFTDVVVTETPLVNGVPQSGLAGANGDSLYYKLVVPDRASLLKFTITGSTGDADLYVKYGEAPTDSVYECRPYSPTSNETCSIPDAQAGPYYVRVKAYRDFSGVTLTGSYKQFRNATAYAIQDYATVNSPITVSGVAGNAPANLSVGVDIRHTYQGDLKVDLVAPDGTLFNLRNRAGGGADDIVATFTVNASAKPANGTWKLRVYDGAGGDVGTLKSWNLKF